MRRTSIAIATLLGCGLLASAIASQPVATPAKAIEARAIDPTPESRLEGEQAIDAAVAAAVIGAISTQFGERTVEVKLDALRATPISLVETDVEGAGRLQFGSDDEWIPFRFATLYDTTNATVTAPRLTIGTDEPGQEIAADSAMAMQLAAQVDGRLRDEFAQQRAAMVLDKVTVVDAGKRYMRVEAIGTANFSGEGATAANVKALYDRRDHQWLRVDYELGTGANRGALQASIAGR
jgi:hypothetical protein